MFINMNTYCDISTRKNDFAEIFKNLAKYRFENNFVELSK